MSTRAQPRRPINSDEKIDGADGQILFFPLSLISVGRSTLEVSRQKRKIPMGREVHSFLWFMLLIDFSWHQSPETRLIATCNRRSHRVDYQPLTSNQSKLRKGFRLISRTSFRLCHSFPVELSTMSLLMRSMVSNDNFIFLIDISMENFDVSSIVTHPRGTQELILVVGSDAENLLTSVNQWCRAFILLSKPTQRNFKFGDVFH